MVKALLAVAGLLALAAGCGTPPPFLAESQLCELWIGHELGAVTDRWERRLAMNVRCEGSQEEAGFILVTLRLADGEEPLTDAAARRLEGAIAGALDAAVEARGWRVRYPSLTVQYMP